jgi:hypothetical protein
MHMGLVKGVKNLLGRKGRKARKAAKRHDNLNDKLSDGLHDDMWTNNPMASAAPSTARVNPLFEPTPPAAAPAPPKNQFEALAKQKKNSTGKGTGKGRMKDRHVGEMKSGDADDVAASAHEVKRVDYAREIGDSGTNEGFFKPADEVNHHESVYGERSGVGAWDMDNAGVETLAEAPRLIARSVASTRLDQGLGLDTIAHEFEAKHAGEKGVVSAKTDGVASHDVEDIDYSNPETQRSVANIQVFDFLSNQQDRHGGNIFIDQESGTAKGIDNDISFGKTSTKANDRNHGLPSQIDSEMADRVSSMTEKELRGMLKGKRGDYQKLNKEEVDAAVARLHELQGHIAMTDDEGNRSHVVDEWNDDTFQSAIDESSESVGDVSKAFNAGAVGSKSKSLIARMHNQQEYRKAAM